MAKVVKAAWLPISEGRVLFARKHGDKHFINVGGKVEDGESVKEALIREVKEETGVDLDPSSIRLLKVFSGPHHNKPGTTLEIHCFQAHGVGKPKPQREIAELAWFTSRDGIRTTVLGRQIRNWLHEERHIK